MRMFSVINFTRAGIHGCCHQNNIKNAKNK